MSDERKKAAALAVVDAIVAALNGDYQGHWYTTHDVLHLIKVFGDAGFFMVPAADVPTPEERAVLEAMKLVPVTWLEMAVGSSQITRGLAPLAAAELARRAAKEVTGG